MMRKFSGAVHLRFGDTLTRNEPTALSWRTAVIVYDSKVNTTTLKLTYT